MNKQLIRVISTAFIGFLIYHSIYFEKLSEHKNNSGSQENFEPKAHKLLEQISTTSYLQISELQLDIDLNIDNAFEKHGNRLGIGSSSYFMVEIKGKIEKVTEREIKIKAANGQVYAIDLLFIFGNAIRDASKLVKLTDYKKTSDFNALSEAINTQVRDHIKGKGFKPGDIVLIKAACKLNKQITDLTKHSFIPVSIQK